MRRSLRLALVVLLLAPLAAAQGPAPGFAKGFSPEVIGPGNLSTLTFTIDNSGSAQPVTDLAFSDAFPAGMTVASPSGLATTCVGGSRDGTQPVLTGAPGASSVSLASGSVPGGATCTVSVRVTSSTVGTVTNTSGALTSSAGSSGTATDDLTVDASRPAFSKSFADPTVAIGARTTLTFTIDNSANASAVNNLDFTDSFPAGLEVAGPANASTTCGTTVLPATVVAAPGAASVTLDANGAFGFPAVEAGASCTVSVDVAATGGGSLVNAVELLADFQSAGLAVDVLDVVASTLSLAKNFLDDPVAPGGTSRLRFRLRSLSREGVATGVAFSDDLDAALAGTTASGLPLSACGGTVSSPDGGSTIELSGGTLASGEQCSFVVPVAVPAGAATGVYVNTTSAVTGSVGGSPAAGAPASDELFVAAIPTFAKAFTDDPVAPGGTVTLEYSLASTSPSSATTDIAFTDELTTILPLPLSVALPASGFCGSGSSLTLVSLGTDQQAIQLTGGSLAPAGSPGDTCTFSVAIDIPQGLAGGTFTSTSGAVSATVDGTALTGGTASDDLVVLDGPTLRKAFTDSPVAPGAAATLEFTIMQSETAAGSASGIAFDDDLDAVIAGLVAAGFPTNTCDGSLSTANAGGTIVYQNGTLAPGESCTIVASLAVPAGAAPGDYTNTTSDLTSTVLGLPVATPPAVADLTVTALSLAKAFPDGPAATGGTATLSFTLDNAGASAATDFTFQDDVDAMLAGATIDAGSLPPTACGGSLVLSNGDRLLTFAGGTLAGGTSCSFTVTVDIPANAVPARYRNRTTRPSATVDGAMVRFVRAAAFLFVEDTAPPLFAKAFAPDDIPVGGTSVLTFTIDNASNTAPATALAFTDVYPAGLVTATPDDRATTCGGTLTVGAGEVSLAGGSVGAGETCEVSVAVTAAESGAYVNESGALTSSLGTSGTAQATLTVRNTELAATKTDALADADGDDAADAGETISYTVVLTNLSTRQSPALSFADTPGAGTALVPGTVTTDFGTVTTGNGAGDTDVFVDIGAVRADTFVVVTFDVLVGDVGGAAEVCNQGTLSGGVADVLTDDPGTGVSGDATCTLTDPNDPPVADAGEDATVECTGPGGASVTLDGSGSSDPNDDALTYTWTGGFPEGGGTVTGVDPTVTLPVGVHTVTLTVEDPAGETSTDTVEITVEDTTPPQITLNGGAAVTVVRFSGPYVDPGATAEDACEGPVAVAVSGTVDTAVAGTYVLTYNASDGAGNGAQATRTVTVVEDPGTVLSPYLILAEDVKVSAQARTEGDVHANDKLELKKGLRANDGGPSRHIGDLTSSDDLKVHKDQVVEGDVTAPSVDIKNGAVVTGTVTEAAVAMVPLPDVDVDASGADVDVDEGETVALAPGSYGEVDVDEGGVLVLASGHYIFEELELDDDAEVRVVLTSGPTVVEIENDLEAKKRVRIGPAEADARYFTLRVAGNKVDLGDDAVVAAQVVAPDAKVTVGKGSRFVGLIIGEDVELKEDAVAIYGVAAAPAALVLAPETLDAPASDAATAAEADEPAGPEASAGPAPAAVAAPEALPAELRLGAAFPNPATGAATVPFDLPEATAVTVTVYDLLGRTMATLADGPTEAGRHTARLDAGALATGSYLVRLMTADGRALVQRLTVLR